MMPLAYDPDAVSRAAILAATPDHPERLGAENIGRNAGFSKAAALRHLRVLLADQIVQRDGAWNWSRMDRPDPEADAPAEGGAA